MEIHKAFNSVGDKIQSDKDYTSKQPLQFYQHWSLFITKSYKQVIVVLILLYFDECHQSFCRKDKQTLQK